jgi:hypothetical protein
MNCRLVLSTGYRDMLTTYLYETVAVDDRTPLCGNWEVRLKTVGNPSKIRTWLFSHMSLELCRYVSLFGGPC